MAVAIQPALARPMSASHIPIGSATNSSPIFRRHNSAKDDQLLRPSSNNNRPRRERPCDACRRRKSRCVIKENTVICVLCEFHKQSCTFIQDPTPRKRKVPGSIDQRKPESQRV
jgi:hypothetical protein